MDTVALTLWRRLLGAAFGLLYHQFAWSYDLVSWLASLGEWRRWQHAALEFADGRVLELAHGTGHLLLTLSRTHRGSVGLDLSPQMSRIAAHRLRRAGVAAPLLRARAQQLPFAAASFDTIIATFPTDYILDRQTLDAVRRALAPGGRLVIVAAGRLRGDRLHHKLIALLFRITGQSTSDDGDLWQSWQRHFLAANLILSVHPLIFDRSETTVLVARPVRRA